MQGYNPALANYNLHSQDRYLPNLGTAKTMARNGHVYNLSGRDGHRLAEDDNTKGIRAIFALIDYILASQDYNLLLL